MSPFHRLLPVLAGVVLLIGPVSAGAATDPLAGDGTVSLSGPEVVKLDWNTRALTPVDVDGDGLTDLAVVNNDRAAIELLLQIKPGSPPTPVAGAVNPSTHRSA